MKRSDFHCSSKLYRKPRNREQTIDLSKFEELLLKSDLVPLKNELQTYSSKLTVKSSAISTSPQLGGICVFRSRSPIWGTSLWRKLSRTNIYEIVKELLWVRSPIKEFFLIRSLQTISYTFMKLNAILFSSLLHFL